MTTKNLIPRGSGEGGIGITGTPWGSGVFNSGIFNDSLTVGGEQVALSSELSNYTTSDDLSECINYTVGLTGHIIPDTNAAYDLGNAEYKIRHLFLSDNSLHIGGTTISAGDTLGEIQFPSGITVTKDSIFNGTLDVEGTIRSNVPGANSFCLITYGGGDTKDTNGNNILTQPAFILNREDSNGNPEKTVSIHSDKESYFNGGNVGIGITNPSAKLEIVNSSNHLNLKVDDTISQSVIKFSDDDGLGAAINFDHNTDKLHFITDGTATPSNGALNIDSDGNVGIGNTDPGAKLDIDGAIHVSGVAMTPDEEGRINFGPSGIMVGQAEVRPDPDNPESIYFQAVPQVKDSEGNAVTVLTADKLGLGTTAVLESAEQDLQFKLLTDQQRFVVGTTGDYGLQSGWYRFNDFKVKGATDIGAHPINPVDTRIYSDESSFVLFKTDTAGNRVAHLVGGDEEVSANNAIALGIAVKVDNSESPEDIEFVHTDGESYSVINGNSDSVGTNGLPIRQGFQNSSIGSSPAPLLIDGGSF
jgi:hypothetical protein